MIDISPNKYVWLLLVIIITVLSLSFAGYNVVFNSNQLVVNTNIDALSNRLLVLEQKLSGMLESTSDLPILPHDSRNRVEEESRLSAIESNIESLNKMFEALIASNDGQSNSAKYKQPMSFDEQQRLTKQNHEFIDESFFSQDVDQIWATGVEVQMDEVFYNKPELQAVELTELDCRSTMCRASLVHQKVSSLEEGELESHLLIDLLKVFKGGVNMRREYDANGEVKLTAYLVKEGHQIPQLSQNSSGARNLGN